MVLVPVVLELLVVAVVDAVSVVILLVETVELVAVLDPRIAELVLDPEEVESERIPPLA